MLRKQLAASFDIKMSEGADAGVLTVKASSFGNEDTYGDIIESNAFDEDIARISMSAKLPMLWQHRADEPIGHWYRAWKEGQFLYMEGKLSLGIRKADEARINLLNGDVSGISIGFNSDDAVERRDDKGRYEGMTFNKVRLMESSIVTFPANSLAQVDAVKSETRLREFEKFLVDAARDADIALSRRDVEALSRSVWPKLATPQVERDADEFSDGLDAAENELLEALRGFKV